MNDFVNTEGEKFYSSIKQRHRRINPCFMTGKGCVHTEHIDKEWEERNEKNDIITCFMVRPFRPNIESFFELCLERYIKGNYSSNKRTLILEQADRIRRTGYIVCEKICRRVQSVDFLVIDVSAPNANVFYELGLAYGIEQKILVIHQESSKFGRRVATYLEDAGCRVYPYKDLNPINSNEFPLSNYIWRRIDTDGTKSITDPTILLIARQYGFLANVDATSSDNGKIGDKAKPETMDESYTVDNLLGPPDIQLNFETHMKAAIGVAVSNIVIDLKRESPKSIPQHYIKLIQGLQSPEEVKKDASFHEVRQQVDKAYCTIIHTGGKTAEPMAYFWLGYCHANGKNVIPVTVIDNPNDNIDDLAFDIRALWHMTFMKSNPSHFAHELQDTLQQMIVSDFSEWSRSTFWDEMLDRRGRVSIFTGALHNDPIGRDMIGDWDLRAASELTSFFASHQYRATIESPIYQIEQVTKKRMQATIPVKEADYVLTLERLLAGKNCIIIASPDVNPLTEILLGKLYEVDRRKWFSDNARAEKAAGAVVAFKEAEAKKSGLSKNKTKTHHGRAFYHQILLDSSPNDGKKRLKRGFEGHGVPQNRLSGEFLSQKDENGVFTVHAHLVIAKNPFDPPESEHHIIILNGVSGPATFALTHVLTGGESTQFVAYKMDFNADGESEVFLQQVNRDLDMMRQDQVRGVQYFVEVKVGPPEEEKDITGKHIYDWRRILSWERIGKTPGYIYSQTSTHNKI